MNTLFANITVVTMDEAMHVYPNAFVGVTDGKISYLSGKAPSEKPEKIINGEGMVLMPGLINCHTHLPMSLLRSYADSADLAHWLNDYIFPREERMDGRCVKAATLLSIAECLRFGITSVSDMYFCSEEIAQAVAESGIKANLGHSSTLFGEDFDLERHPDFVETVVLHEKWHGYDNGRIKVDACIHAEFTSDYRLWEALAEFAINNKLGMQLHLSETAQEQDSCLERCGLTPAQVLDCHHVFDVPTTAAHCVHLAAEDMPLLAKRGVSAVHCPVSNLKLADGCADVVAMVKAGMNVCLGTDGVASNNNHDMFEEMKAASLMARAIHHDAKALPAQAALMMATVCGARAQGRAAECGQIKLGMDADLIMLDFTSPQMIPCHNVLSHLVYVANGRDVVMTMVRGKILYAQGEYPTIDLPSVVNELSMYAVDKVFSQDEKE